MITWEQISKAVEPMKTVNIKGKEYATVPERVKAFRTICPGGSITTEIVSLDGDTIIMKATIADEDGKVLSTGMAREEKQSSYINKTSFVENCETSAVGRALGWIALGVDASMCSAEELVNAVINQNKNDTPEKPNNAKIAKEWCESMKITTAQFGEHLRAAVAAKAVPDKRLNDMTDEEFNSVLKWVAANAS